MPDIKNNDSHNENQAAEEVYEDQSIDIENQTSDEDLEEVIADMSVDTIAAYTMGTW